jgi:pyrimidine deaminase RibD-like protein
MTCPRYKVRVGTAPNKENANEIRRQGIKTLEEAGIRVGSKKSSQEDQHSGLLHQN